MPRKNKLKEKIYHAKWYKKNKIRVRNRIKERRKELQLWFKEYKKTLKCNRCPENHPACLEFHHKDRNKKEKTISFIFKRTGWGIKRVMEEISKCEILCANCHRKETSKEEGWYPEFD